MSDLDEIINVTFAIDSSGIEKQNFFVPMILSHTVTFPDRIRFYSSLAAVVVDCPVPTSPEYLMAQDLFSQTPHPAVIAIGRATAAITLAYKVAPRTVGAGQTYAIDVAGTGVTSTRISYTPLADLTGTLLPRTTNVLTLASHGFTTGDGPVRVSNSGGALPTGLAVDTDYWLIAVTANTFSFATSKALALATTAVALSGDGSGTQTIRRAQNDVVCANLLQQANLVVGKNFTVAQVTGAGETDYLTFTATVANAWFALGPTDTTMLDVYLTNSGDPTSDLNAIVASSASAAWYQLLTIYNSPSYVLAASSWVESNGRTYIVDFCDTQDINTTSTGSSGTGDQINATGRTRTLWNFHPRPQDTVSASLSGRIVALNPGSWTAAFKTLSGPVAVTLTDTQKFNLKARRGNYYTTRAGRAVTLYGYVGSTAYKFFDIVVGLDYIYNDIQTRCFGVFAGNDKLGYDDADIDQLAATIRGGIATWKSADYKIISEGTPGSSTDPVPSITFPSVDQIDSTQRGNRNLPNGVLVFRLLGAIQSVAVRVVITF